MNESSEAAKVKPPAMRPASRRAEPAVAQATTYHVGPGPFAGMGFRRRLLAGIAGFAAMALGLLLATPALAGTITLTWDPVSNPDLAGYRIFTGTSSGNYSQTVDVGPATSMETISGLNDCTTYYLAMKSLANDGSESADFSQEVAGFTRPSLSLVQPGLVAPDSTVAVTLDGVSFQDGATLAFSAPGITASAVTVESCSRITATLTVAAGAPLGAVDVTVVNPGGVPGTLAAALSVAVDPGPAVTSVQPADGAVDTQPGTAVVATFDRDLLAASVSNGTVILLDAGGTAVAQAAGSPVLAGNVVTLQPAAPLNQDSVYRLQILGGANGVKDTAGVPMAATFQQVQGFVILNLPPSEVDNLRRMDLTGG